MVSLDPGNNLLCPLLITCFSICTIISLHTNQHFVLWTYTGAHNLLLEVNIIYIFIIVYAYQYITPLCVNTIFMVKIENEH